MAKKQEVKEVIIVGSKTKDIVKSLDCNTAGDFIEALSDRAHEMVHAAVERAKANGRKTVRATDL